MIKFLAKLLRWLPVLAAAAALLVLADQSQFAHKSHHAQAHAVIVILAGCAVAEVVFWLIMRPVLKKAAQPQQRARGVYRRRYPAQGRWR